MVDGPLPRGKERLADEDDLLERYFQDRQPAVREELVERFIPLARSLANRYSGGAEPTEDLHQVASVGLVKAIEGYDPTLGHSFVSYAAPTILGELKRHFRDRGRQVHLPRGLQERIAMIEQAADELPTSLARQPSAADVADHTGLDVEEVLEALEASSARRPYSLDVPAGADEESAPLGELLGSDDPGYETVEYGEAISRSMSALSDRDREILHLRFVEDLTQSEIADRIGISQMHVSRLLRRTLDRLRADVDTPD